MESKFPKSFSVKKCLYSSFLLNGEFGYISSSNINTQELFQVTFKHSTLAVHLGEKEEKEILHICSSSIASSESVLYILLAKTNE